MTSQESAAAVRAARAGDARALEQLIQSLAEQLLPLAAALAAGTGEADALLGDTLSRVYERLGQLRDERAVNAWARRILVRRFLEQRRWSLARPRVSIASVQLAAPAATRPELIDLRTEVAKLVREDRALLVLHYWQRLTIAECADELGLPEGTVKSRLNRALSRLRGRLEDTP